MEEKIIEILKKYEGWVDRSMTNTCVWPDNYEEVANDIVKLFAIPVVRKSFTPDFIVRELEDCDHLDDAIMRFKEQI